MSFCSFTSRRSVLKGNNTNQLLLRTCTKKTLFSYGKIEKLQLASRSPFLPLSQQVVFSWWSVPGWPFCLTLGRVAYDKSRLPIFSSPFFLCLYMYVCVSRKQSDKRHPDLTDGALRPVFLALLPEPVTPAALLWGGRQSWPQPILVPEETQ